ncbi:hypothetical protein BLOT_011989 [Blomia tropicalis]|nr:hypothetical protein BLOT_011989 [Blomia tropicalis]
MLGPRNLTRLMILLMVIMISAESFLMVEAAFEMACMEKCFKTRRCKKYGQITMDVDCDRQCKKKCYKNCSSRFCWILDSVLHGCIEDDSHAPHHRN